MFHLLYILKIYKSFVSSHHYHDGRLYDRRPHSSGEGIWGKVA